MALEADCGVPTVLEESRVAITARPRLDGLVKELPDLSRRSAQREAGWVENPKSEIPRVGRAPHGWFKAQ